MYTYPIFYSLFAKTTWDNVLRAEQSISTTFHIDVVTEPKFTCYYLTYIIDDEFIIHIKYIVFSTCYAGYIKDSFYFFWFTSAIFWRKSSRFNWPLRTQSASKDFISSSGMRIISNTSRTSSKSMLHPEFGLKWLEKIN